MMIKSSDVKDNTIKIIAKRQRPQDAASQETPPARQQFDLHLPRQKGSKTKTHDACESEVLEIDAVLDAPVAPARDQRDD